VTIRRDDQVGSADAARCHLMLRRGGTRCCGAVALDAAARWHSMLRLHCARAALAGAAAAASSAARATGRLHG